MRSPSAGKRNVRLTASTESERISGPEKQAFDNLKKKVMKITATFRWLGAGSFAVAAKEFMRIAVRALRVNIGKRASTFDVPRKLVSETSYRICSGGDDVATLTFSDITEETVGRRCLLLTVTIDIARSCIPEALRAEFIAGLFGYLTYGRESHGRESDLYLGYFEADGVRIDLPDSVRASLDEAYARFVHVFGEVEDIPAYQSHACIPTTHRTRRVIPIPALTLPEGGVRGSIHIETTLVWMSKEGALSEKRARFQKYFKQAFDRSFGDAGVEVQKIPHGSVHEDSPWRALRYGANEILRMVEVLPKGDETPRMDGCFASMFLIEVDISTLEHADQEKILAPLFWFLTYGRGRQDRTPIMFQERLVVNRTFIRLPDYAQESVDRQREEFVQAVLSQ